MSREVKLRAGVFQESDLVAVSDEAILGDPEALANALRMYAYLVARDGAAKWNGTQIHRIAVKAARTME